MATVTKSINTIPASLHCNPDRRLNFAVFEIRGSIRPNVVDVLPLVEQVRPTLIHNYMATSHSEVIAGKTANGVSLKGHEHAHYFAADEDSDGRLNYMIIYALCGFDTSDVAALGQLMCIFRRGNRPDVRMVLIGLGRQEKFASAPMFKPASLALSDTVFAAALCQLRREQVSAPAGSAPKRSSCASCASCELQLLSMK